MKGIILAGGSGTRLAPMTSVTSKQLLPVYDKPMICYPLTNLMNLEIKDILIISTPHDTPNIEGFLGDGKEYGLNIQYKVQEEPKGIAEAFILGEEFIGDDNVCLILGDNIFYGSEISSFKNDSLLTKLSGLGKDIGSYIFAYHVSDPERYGVIDFEDNSDKVTGLEEKPKNPRSNWAATGLYFYDNEVVKIAKSIKPSDRGELEITDVNKVYLEQGRLGAIKLRRGFAWLDAGTPESLLNSAQFIHTIEPRQGLKVACLEEVAYIKGFVDEAGFAKLSEKYKKGSPYRNYLEAVLRYEKGNY